MRAESRAIATGESSNLLAFPLPSVADSQSVNRHADGICRNTNPHRSRESRPMTVAAMPVPLLEQMQTENGLGEYNAPPPLCVRSPGRIDGRTHGLDTLFVPASMRASVSPPRRRHGAGRNHESPSRLSWGTFRIYLRRDPCNFGHAAILLIGTRMRNGQFLRLSERASSCSLR